MVSVGYQFLCQALDLSAFPPAKPARIAPVSRLTATSDAVLVPANVAPAGKQAIEHLLFALKHEGINLPILAQALKRLPQSDIIQQVTATPSSRYARILGFLWEAFHQQELPIEVAITGPTVDLFDPKKYLTHPAGDRNVRWKVRFNGLGTPDYCATVERTPNIERLLALNILDRANEFLDQLGTHATDRALSWAYLHETESSFAIERESLGQNKAEAFIGLLKQAHLPRAMDETYLVELQNAAITNPFNWAASYRTEQNWLRGPLRGAAGVTYVPPPLELVQPLMRGVLYCANELPKQIDPMVAAAIASFGFVFIHPFMDGNGRLSRFLFHYALCQSGRLSHGLLLPVSVAMKRHESDYLDALQTYSMPMRRRWDVRWIGDEDYDLHFKGDDSLYRHWDATAAVEFCLEMAQQALEHDLREETDFLARFDRVFRAIDERFDVRRNDLTTLIISCLQHQGKVSKNRRKQFRDRVPEAAFEALEEACNQALLDASSPSP